MGFPALNLEVDLANRWSQIVRDNGYTVSRLESEESISAQIQHARRVAEVRWCVERGSAKLKVLEARFQDRDYVSLIFFGGWTKEEREVISSLTAILTAAGASLPKRW
jgi:hypothetical protein